MLPCCPSDVELLAHPRLQFGDGTLQAPPLIRRAHFERVSGCSTHIWLLASFCSHTLSSFKTLIVSLGARSLNWRTAAMPNSAAKMNHTNATIMNPKNQANGLPQKATAIRAATATLNIRNPAQPSTRAITA